MNLLDAINDLENLDDEYTIYSQNILDFDSDIVFVKDSDLETILVDGVVYQYLLEVYLAKEIFSEFRNGDENVSDRLEAARRIYHYAIYDA